MEYIKLGNSDLRVSRICLGCMGFGDATIGQHSWTKLFLMLFALVLSVMAMAQGKAASVNNEAMIVRLAEIEVYPEHLQEYLKFANEVDRLSVEREPGVICLFPMQIAEDSTQIRILEIYASEEAYQSHIKTEHFLKYKQGTMHMVKSLKLPTMKPLDPETMKLIFNKQRVQKLNPTS